MPTKPTKTNDLKNMQGVDIINATINEMSDNGITTLNNVVKTGDVLANGRKATKEDSLSSLREVGSILMDFQPTKNAFLSTLVNRIGRVIITSRTYYNPWSMFKKGLMEYGETVEEIFVGMATPYQFDPASAENTVFKRRIPDVKTAFHQMNYQKLYPTTVSQNQLKQAFLSFEGVSDLVGRIIEQVYTGANYDEFLVMKYMIAKLALKGNIHSVNIPIVNSTNARDITTTMTDVARKLSFMSNKYNYAGVETYSDASSIYNILTTKVSSVFDVEVLALSFNMSKAELIGHIVDVDGFAIFDNDRLAKIFENDPHTTYVPFTSDEINKLSSIAGLMVDVDWFMIFDNLYEMGEIYNPEGMYWNYFYQVWKIFSVSPFANAILFTTAPTSITSVTVTPSTATVTKGNTVQLKADVVSTGFVNTEVVWTIAGTDSVNSTITDDGLLTVPVSETNTTLTVTATSVFDKSKKSSATITVV